MSLASIYTISQLAGRPEEVGEALATCIQDYELNSLCLDYERTDDATRHSAAFRFKLSGSTPEGQEFMLLDLQELPHSFSMLLEEIAATARAMQVRFINKFAQDGYSIQCQAIQRRIERS